MKELTEISGQIWHLRGPLQRNSFPYNLGSCFNSHFPDFSFTQPSLGYVHLANLLGELEDSYEVLGT